MDLRSDDMVPERRGAPTMKQFIAMVSFIVVMVNLLQTIGMKLIADAYIDSRIHAHNVDPSAHAGIMAAKVDVDAHATEERAHFQALVEKLDATNQRLARIEGSLGNIRGVK